MKTIFSRKFDANAPMQIDKVSIEWQDDPGADLSYLEQDYADCGEDAEKYREQDKSRLSEYGKTWYMMGCRAVAEVSYPIGNGCRRIECFKSGGLYGVESDSDAEYLESVEKDELNDLKEHLAQFGVKWDIS
jgi:hypothetical protein